VEHYVVADSVIDLSLFWGGVETTGDRVKPSLIVPFGF
jgi:hypothetical protein